MLSLSSNLSSALDKDAIASYWYLKLYYNDETNFIGLSDKDRTINSVAYYGLVTSWSNLTYSANLNDFDVRFAPINLIVTNTPKSIEGGRFSDLYSAKQFTNRKWELYFADDSVTSASDHQIIATGVIGMNTKYDHKKFEITLNNIINKYDVFAPTTTVSGVDAPSENIGKPIPFVYGDFDRNTSLPSSDFDRHTGGHAPMIVSNAWSISGGGIEAKADTEALHTLRDKNVEMYLEDIYASFDDNLVDVTGNPIAYVSGNLLEAGRFATGVTEVQNFSNSTSKTLSVTGDTDDFSFGIPNLPSGVDRSVLKMLVYYTSNMPVPDVAAPNDFFKFTNTANSPISDNLTQGTNVVQSIPLTSTDSGRTIKLRMDATDSGGTYSASIHTILIVGDYDIDDITLEKKTFRTVVDQSSRDERSYSQGEQIQQTEVFQTEEYNIPKNVRMLYGSLKGRKYNSDLTSSRSNGYATTDFIENPVYMIEDIARKILSVPVDTSSFDDYGTKTSGKLKHIFDVSNASDVKLRFSQYKPEKVSKILRRICRQSGLFYHFNESGAIRIFGRARSGYYISGNSSDFLTQTIDFDHCNLENIEYTDSSYLRNHIIIRYGYDYGSEQVTQETSAVTDATSAGNSASGYLITNKLTSDASYINDDTVATAYANTLLDYFKDRKPIIKLTTGRMEYVNIEIGDIVNISNFPSDVKMFGTALASTDYFMVTNISKSPNMIRLTLTEVS